METFLIISNILIWVVLIVQMVLFFTVVRTVNEWMKRFQSVAADTSGPVQLVAGAQAPRFREKAQDGTIIELNPVIGKPMLLFFTFDTCEVCQQLIPELAVLKQASPNLQVIVVAPEDMSLPPKQVPPGIAFVRSDSMLESYQVNQTPYYVWIDAGTFVVDMGVTTNLAELKSRLLEEQRSAG